MSNTFQVKLDKNARTGQVFELFFQGERQDGSITFVSVNMEPAIRVADDKMVQAAKLLSLKAIKSHDKLIGLTNVKAVTLQEYTHGVVSKSRKLVS